MADFLSQSQRYDGPEVESIILDLEDELLDELDVRSTLDSETPQKIAEAQAFLAASSTRVDTQLASMVDLNQKIRNLVAENEQLQLADAEYTALVTSEPYVNVAQKISDLYAISAELVNFLVQKGRRGRPPLN